IEWTKHGGIKNLTGTMEVTTTPYGNANQDLALAAEKTRFDASLYKEPFVIPFTSQTQFPFDQRQLRHILCHFQTPYTRSDIAGTIDLAAAPDLAVNSRTAKITEVDLIFHHLQSYFDQKSAAKQDFWGVAGSADFKGKLTKTVWSPFKPEMTGTVLARSTYYHGV